MGSDVDAASTRNKLGGGTQSKCLVQERRNHRQPERDESTSLRYGAETGPVVVHSRRELAHLNRNCDDDFTPPLPSTSTPTLPLLPSTFRLLMKLIIESIKKNQRSFNTWNACFSLIEKT